MQTHYFQETTVSDVSVKQLEQEDKQLPIPAPALPKYQIHSNTINNKPHKSAEHSTKFNAKKFKISVALICNFQSSAV